MNIFYDEKKEHQPIYTIIFIEQLFLYASQSFLTIFYYIIFIGLVLVDHLMFTYYITQFNRDRFSKGKYC